MEFKTYSNNHFHYWKKCSQNLSFPVLPAAASHFFYFRTALPAFSPTFVTSSLFSAKLHFCAFSSQILSGIFKYQIPVSGNGDLAYIAAEQRILFFLNYIIHPALSNLLKSTLFTVKLQKVQSISQYFM